MKCPDCGEEMQLRDYGTSWICPECKYVQPTLLSTVDGSKPAPTVNGNHCVHCGASLGEGQNFCPKCGKSVTQQTVRRSSRAGGIIMAIIGAIAAIVGVVFLISSNQSTPNYSGYNVGENGYNTAGAAGIEPDYWYHYNAIPYLNVQNCTIENASAGSSHVIVTYHPVCRSCHTEFKTLEIAAPEYGHDVIKNYICPNCYATTRVWLKLSN